MRPTRTDCVICSKRVARGYQDSCDPLEDGSMFCSEHTEQFRRTFPGTPIVGPEGRICETCGRGCLEATGCDPLSRRLEGQDYEPIRFGAERDDEGGETCPHGYCWAMRGGVHHHECPVEECPRCHSRLHACACRKA